MAGSEVDWDDVLPGPVPPASPIAVAAQPPGVADAAAQHWDVAVRPRDRDPAPEGDSALDAVKPRAVRQSRWRVKLPPPKQRNFEQHCLVAARMRDAKARNRSSNTKARDATLFKRTLQKLRKAGLLRDGGKSRVALSRTNGLSIVIAGGSSASHRLPMEAMQHLAFSDIKRRNDCARACGVDEKTVTKVKNLVAATGRKADDAFMSNLADSYDEEAPEIFVAGIMGDATSEQLLLPMIGTEEHQHVTRSSWHVQVSQHRFAWQASSTSGWNRCDFVRPNVAMVSSETAETLWEAMYGVPAVATFTKLETRGLATATFAALHFDLDGHAANPPLTALRRQQIIDETGKTPLVSRFHCGNHCENLVDVATMESIDDGLFQVMSAGSAFFHMGGNFIRLIQSCPLEIQRNMVAPVVGDPPPQAQEVSKELMDYAIQNYKLYKESHLDEPWSSDEEEEEVAPDDDEAAAAAKRKAYMKRRRYLYRKSWEGLVSIFNGIIWATVCTLGPHFSNVLLTNAERARQSMDAARFLNEVLTPHTNYAIVLVVF